MSTIPGLTLVATASDLDEVAVPAAAALDVPSTVAALPAEVEVVVPDPNRRARPAPRTDETNTATTRAATASGLVRFGGAGGGCMGAYGP